MRGYGRLCERLGALGFRHTAEALRAPAPKRPTGFGGTGRAGADDGFRVLDGLWFRGRGTLWQRVDGDYVRQARADWLSSGESHAAGVVDVLDTLEAFVRQEPMGLRRVLLWQLGCLLRDGADGPTPKAAEALGVHEDEAGYLADAVAAGFPASGAARQAAERLGDVWPGQRLCAAEKLAAEVPDTGRDPFFTRLREELRERRNEVDRRRAEADRLTAEGRTRDAADAAYQAARRAADDPALQVALLGAAARLTDGWDGSGGSVGPSGPNGLDGSGGFREVEGPRLVAVGHERTVALTWPPPRTPSDALTFRLLRFPDGSPEDAVELAARPVAEDGHTDTDAPAGCLRYAVVPLRGGVIAGVPLVSVPVVVAPEATGAVAAVVPEGVRLSWKVDPVCAEVAVERNREGDGGWPVRVECERDGLLDVPLPAGDHRYEIRCGYRGPDGRMLWSEGVRVSVRAEEWPGRVEDLAAWFVGDGGRVALTWRPPARGQGAVVPWPTGPVRAGRDVSRRTDVTVPGSGPVPESPGSAAGFSAGSSAEPAAEPAAEVAVPEGGRVRMAAVSVLGERVLTGPAVVVERPGAVADLTVERISADRAVVRFGWPEPAVLVLVTWEGGGRREERRVARSRFVADRGVELPVNSDTHRVTVVAVPRPDAVTAPADPAFADLPAWEPPPPLLLPALAPFPGWHSWPVRRGWWRRLWPFRS